MRTAIVLAIVGLAAAPVAAERRQPVEWKRPCVLALVLWDVHRFEVAPFAGTSLGSARRDFGVGAAVRYLVTENVMLDVDVRGQLGDDRSGAASLELAYRLGLGLERLDFIGSAGPGVVWTRNGAQPAVGVGVTGRVFVTPGLTIELGLHDDILVGGSAGAVPRHAVEVRIGVGLWWPRYQRRCVRRGC